MMTFAALLVTQKREKKMLFYVSSRANDVRPYHTLSKPPQQPKQKIYAYPLFLLQKRAQKKKLSKRKRRNKISRSAERDEDSASSTRKPLKRLDLNFNKKSDG